MKIYLFIIFSMMSIPIYSQEYIVTPQTITGNFRAEGKTRDQIFNLITDWIIENYGSGRDAVRLYDNRNYQIILGGINKSLCKNPASVAYPDNIFIPYYISVLCMHTMEFRIKDGSYSITYTLGDVNPPGLVKVTDRRFVNAIRLDTIFPTDVETYNKAVNTNLKAGLMGKYRRELILAGSIPMFKELRSDIIHDVKSLMVSVSNTVNKSSSAR
ncbi:MAG TPA: DUF4468 domain-containing protein [Bacteroidales bacterium]|nr:DUF4468 domain-containing protein [Bacteroidales bacterium]